MGVKAAVACMRRTCLCLHHAAAAATKRKQKSVSSRMWACAEAFAEADAGTSQQTKGDCKRCAPAS